MKEYNIGQVLFVLLKGDTSIHPVMIVEEVKKKTLQGATTEYTVETVAKAGKRNRVPLSDLDATVFDDISSAREFLLRNANDAIERICENAVRFANKNFSDRETFEKPHVNNTHHEEVNGETVVLENGVKARISIPENWLE